MLKFFILGVIVWLLAAPPLEAYTESVQDLVYRLAPAYGQDPEVVLAIRHCESRVGSPLHTNDNGSVDIGELQINNSHEIEAKFLGLDLYTTRDNLIYGLWLMSQQGTAPWMASRSCWVKFI